MIALLADDNPVDVEVDSDVTELLVELNPVDSELMPVEVDVDNDVIALLADDNPVDVEVDSDVTELLVEPIRSTASRCPSKSTWTAT